MPTPQILIVDDEPDLIRMYADYLRYHGYAVLTACEGETALYLARHQPPDIILLDVRLPGASGIDLLAEFFKLLPAVSIIMLSAVEEVAVVVAAFHGGATTYLPKTTPLPQVLAAVTTAWQVAQSRALRTYGNLRLDLRAQQVFVNDTVIPVTPHEWTILDRLARETQGASYATLWEEVWQHPGPCDKPLIQRTLSYLRQKIGDAHILAIHGWGYRLH